MLNFCYLYIIKTPCQNKIITVIKLCKIFKEKDSIWMMFKKFQNWMEKKREKNLDVLQKIYVRMTNMNTMIKQIYDYHYTFDFYSSN